MSHEKQPPSELVFFARRSEDGSESVIGTEMVPFDPYNMGPEWARKNRKTIATPSWEVLSERFDQMSAQGEPFEMTLQAEKKDLPTFDELTVTKGEDTQKLKIHKFQKPTSIESDSTD